MKRLSGLFVVFFAASLLVSAQTAPVKKNQRPGTATETVTPTPTPEPETKGQPTKYFYSFERPGFVVNKVLILHDESGRGTVTFVKEVSKEEITDPLQVSPTALTRIEESLKALDFFNSTENYQYEKDYSHLGNIVIRIERDGKSREVKFNWTDNVKARNLSDEYRRLSNQYVWLFEMNLARVNQPLETPKLMTGLDMQLRRNEISDPRQLLPYLREVSNDERIPLISRNHAKRIIERLGEPNPK